MKKITKIFIVLISLVILGITSDILDVQADNPNYCEDNCYPDVSNCSFIAGGENYICYAMKKITKVE